MDTMQWSNPQGSNPVVMSEYVMNGLGVFVKRERRMPKNAKFTALTGFRVGYTLIKGTDYRAAPLDRMAILWYKVTSVKEISGDLIISGNQKDSITLSYPIELKEQVLLFIERMINSHPPMIEPDYSAASWMCFRDDDEWTDAQMSLVDMIEEELNTDRFIEPEILEETRLLVMPEPFILLKPTINQPIANFCPACGVALEPGSLFCHGCGTPIS